MPVSLLGYVVVELRDLLTNTNYACAPKRYSAQGTDTEHHNSIL